MLKLGYALLALTAFNLLLLLSILYWFVFDNSVPPFIQGRPREDVVFPLAILSLGTGFFGAAFYDLNRSK